MYQQGSEVGVATLADTKQILFTTAGMLFGNQAQPCRHLSAAVKVLGITDGGDQRTGCDRSNAWYLCELGTDLAAAMPGLNLHFKFTDLAIQFLKMVQQPLNEYPKRARQLVACIFNKFRNPCGDVTNALWDDQPEFTKKTADLVGLGSARLHKTLTDPVQCQNRLLLNVLDRNKTHIRPATAS